jgi:hypothetical protein
MEGEKSLEKKLAKIPYPAIALGMAGMITGAAYFFVYLAKFLYTIPRDFDLPWLFVFALVFLAILVKKRVKTMKSDSKPALS